MRYRALSLALVRNVSTKFCCFSDDFLRVAICAIVSTSCFLALLEDATVHVELDEVNHRLRLFSEYTCVSAHNDYVGQLV